MGGGVQMMPPAISATVRAKSTQYVGPYKNRIKIIIDADNYKYKNRRNRVKRTGHTLAHPKKKNEFWLWGAYVCFRQQKKPKDFHQNVFNCFPILVHQFHSIFLEPLKLISAISGWTVIYIWTDHTMARTPAPLQVRRLQCTRARAKVRIWRPWVNTGCGR